MLRALGCRVLVMSMMGKFSSDELVPLLLLLLPLLLVGVAAFLRLEPGMVRRVRTRETNNNERWS
jgi:hypothetical protein